jgi:bifunctional enzyme CysN/CysC
MMETAWPERVRARAQPHPPEREERSGGEIELLRFSTAGSVDDGKSTLIGRLLYDTKSILQDQMEAVERTSRERGEGYVNLALLTDGLRAEREQNITIDVAYRYFATPRRRFIIADTPGHVQYTRNMVTGASTAQLAIVLVDARKGVLTQSRRHGFIASLLRIPHLVVAVNKMDLVDYDEEVYARICGEYRAFASGLDVGEPTFIPISALRGDNVVDGGERMPWYRGPTLLEHLETVDVNAGRNLEDLRLPVQYVVRPHQDYRGLAGRIASGTLRPGDAVVALPVGAATRIRSIDTPDGPLREASAGDSVVVTLEDELDVGRGGMLVRAADAPSVGTRFEAVVCWMNERPLDRSVPYQLMHTTRQTRAFVTGLAYRIDVDTLRREPAATLELNDIGRVEVTTSQPLFFDDYARNPATGSFILVDPRDHATVAAGMIRAEARQPERDAVSPGVVWEEWNVPRTEREARSGHGAAVLWFTGLSGAGKSTIARALERTLFEAGCRTMLLDGDQLRHGLCGDLGFSPADRAENIRRAGEVARLFFESGAIVLCAFVSPFREDRERVRARIPADRFLEIHVHADLDTLTRRDTKGLYARALAGEIRDLTGVGAPYEAPENPELRIDTRSRGVAESVREILDRLAEAGIIGAQAEAAAMGRLSPGEGR